MCNIALSNANHNGGDLRLMAEINFEQVDAARRKLGIRPFALCRRAGVPVSTWWRVATGRMKAWRPSTGDRFMRALTHVEPTRRPEDYEAERMRLAYRGHLGMIALKMGVDPAKVQAEPNARRFWPVRCLAIYATSIELDIRGAELARALGLSKQVVSWNRKKAEDMRGDPTIDAMVESVGKFIKAREDAP